MDAADPQRTVEQRLARADCRAWRRPTLVVATGKAAAGMARALDPQVRGFVLLPVGVDAAALPSGLEILRGGHPVPTAQGIAASARILSAVSRLERGDRLLYLVSGGTSALFEVPRDDVRAEDLIETYRALLASGAPIQAVNVVRRALSRVKGGGLARAAWPAEVLALAISDVTDDDPATIGSGPTVPRREASGAASDFLARYRLRERVPAAIVAALARPQRALPRMIATRFEIVCSNVRSRQAASRHLVEAGYRRARPTRAVLEGDVAEAARMLCAAVDRLLRAGGRRAFVVGGETTVRLRSPVGVGGRNQHLAALVALGLAEREEFALMAGGTDGIDGGSEAAGALVDGRTAGRAAAGGASLDEAVRNLDSGSALAGVGASVRTGPTGTNVGDLVVVATAASR